MSLTTSPSPVASPRAAFHLRSYAPSGRSSARSPRFSAKSPKRWDVPAPSATSAASVVRPTRDVGTQYSPDGYPPTASSAYIPTPTASTSTKRKQPERSPPMSQQPPPPPEPALCVEPTAIIKSRPSSSTTTAVTERPAEQLAHNDEEALEEARSTSHRASDGSKKARGVDRIINMPAAYEDCDAKELGKLISNMLMELIRINDKIPLRDGRLTRFHSRAPPSISVHDYLQRLIQHATLSPPILLSMVFYIDRLCASYSAFTINSLTVHRFLITAACVAAKGLSDSFWTNPTYARIGGIPLTELATLEMEFLTKVEWRIVPMPEVLEDYYSSLVDRSEDHELESVASSEEADKMSE